MSDEPLSGNVFIWLHNYALKHPELTAGEILLRVADGRYILPWTAEQWGTAISNAFDRVRTGQPHAGATALV